MFTWWAGSGSKSGGRRAFSVCPEGAELPPLLAVLPWEPLLRECFELGDAHSTPVAGGNRSACCMFRDVQIWKKGL